MPSQGKVFAWGLGGSGQLGNKSTCSSNTPQIVHRSWTTQINSVAMNSESQKFNSINYRVKRIYSGGHHCFATVTTQEVS